MLFSRLRFALLVALLLGTTFPAQAATPPVRQRILLDSGWRFQRSTPPVLGHSVSITSWRWRPGQPAEESAMTAATVDTTGGDWKDAPIGLDTFANRIGFAWYRTTLPNLPFADRTLLFPSVDDNATVYLNGVKLVTHNGWNDPFDVALDAAWKMDGPNTLTVLVENTAGGGGIAKTVTLGTAAPKVALGDPSRPVFNDRAWRTVHLPHDYVLESAFTPEGDTSHGSLIPTPAWYRKTFTLPASDRGKSLWLDFDGVYRDSTVYLNGVKLGGHACGYTPFRFDISRAAHYGGVNTLAVQVNPQHEEGWWYEGGGIYRHVWLNVAAPVHVAPWGTFVTAKLPEPVPGQPVASATVTVKTTVTGLHPIQGYTVYAGIPPVTVKTRTPHYRLVSSVLSPSGKVVASSAMPLGVPLGTQDFTQQVKVAAPVLWSIETPRLYHLHTELRDGQQVIDSVDTPFGIRTIRFDADKGFFLNGKSVKIKGTCNHQDFAGVGIGMPDSLLSWRVKKLKQMGSNAYRMSHNPPAPELLDACDKLGMLVMDENRHLGDTENGKAGPDTPYANLQEVQTMILRDRNHPSIIMWSMCNEEPQQAYPHGRDIFAAMKKVVDAADGTRPVTCAMDNGYTSLVGITSVEDLQGINYHPWDYDPFHKAHPKMPLYGSETSSEVGTRGIYGPDKFTIDKINYIGDQAKGYVSAYDAHAPGWAETAEASWQPIADRPFVAGGYVWTGFDYKGETTPFGWPDINSHFGIMDECGFPKDNYYYYQSVWGSKPIVHLLPHWNWPGKEAEPIDVWAYSNADHVELFLNGRSLGDKAMPKNGHVEWSVPYAPGTLEARGYRQGQLIATDKVQTTSAPAALKLTTDRTKLTADGEDVTMIEVDVVDAVGRLVPTANNLVTFTVTRAGHVAGVGNGDPSSHEADKAKRRSAFNGKCLVIVGAGETPGPLQLTATSPGLSRAVLALKVVR